MADVSTERRRVAALGVLAALAIGLLVLPGAHATQSVSTARYAGVDRYETARAIAKATYTTVGEAVVTSGEVFPDALAASYLAGNVAGPILLTRRDTLPAVTATTLKDLGVTKVTLVGGEQAISKAVEDQLKASYAVTRLSGADRYETARAVATSQPAANVGSVGGKKTALVASGENFPDALAGGAPAFAKKFPMVLTTAGALSPAAAAALDALVIKHVILLGGTSAVTSATQAAIEAKGITVERIAGANRSDTAAKLAEYALVQLGFSNSQVVLASGRSFPDALAGAPNAGKSLTPVLLMGSVPPETAGYVRNHNSTISALNVYGGTAVIADTDVQEVKGAATCAPAATTTSLPVPLPPPSTTAPSTTSTSATGPTTTAVGPTTSTTAPPCSTPTTSQSGSTSTSTPSSSTTTLQCVPGTPLCT